MVNIASEMSVDRVALISADYRATKAFLSEAANHKIRVQDVYEYYNFRDPETLQVSSSNFTHEITKFVVGIDDAGPEPVIALITDNAEDVVKIAEALDKVFDGMATYPMWLIGTVGLDLYIPDSSSFSRKSQAWRRVFHAGVLIEPHLPELEEFKKYFDDSIKVSYFSVLTIK